MCFVLYCDLLLMFYSYEWAFVRIKRFGMSIYPVDSVAQ